MRKAAERIAELVDPAITALGAFLGVGTQAKNSYAQFLSLGVRANTVARVAQDLLDRTGYKSVQGEDRTAVLVDVSKLSTDTLRRIQAELSLTPAPTDTAVKPDEHTPATPKSRAP